MPCVLLRQSGAGGSASSTQLQYAVITCADPVPGSTSGPATPGEPESGAAGDTPYGQNDTSLPEQSSHLDAPKDELYVLCGVVIAMLLVGLIIVLLAVTISKLRKRDDPAAAAAAGQEMVLHTTGPAPPPPPAPQPVTIATIFGSEAIPVSGPTIITTTPTSTASNGAAASPSPPPLLWQYPAPYTLYGKDQETPVHGLPAERDGFCRGFRRTLRGRWRRLVRRKPAQDPYALPAEVRDQLKQIYVY